MNCKVQKGDPVALGRLSAMSEDVGGCRVYVGSKSNKGYGRIWWNGQLHQAHRISYEVNIGPIPAGKHVLHRCDNPPCVNPEHLFVGTNMDNVQDKIVKGRQHRGETTGTSKLKEEQVRAIKADTRSNTAVARAYGVVKSLISEIRSGKKWAHIRDQPGNEEFVTKLREKLPRSKPATTKGDTITERGAA